MDPSVSCLPLELVLNPSLVSINTGTIRSTETKKKWTSENLDQICVHCSHSKGVDLGKVFKIDECELQAVLQIIGT